MRGFWTIVLTFLATGLTIGQVHFDWTSEVDSAYDLVLQFRMDEAGELARKSSMSHANNIAWDYVLGDISMLTVLVEERPEELSGFYNNVEQFIDRAERLPEDNPWRNVLLGEYYFKRGLINTMNEHNLSAARDIFKGYHKFERAYEVDSTFYPARLGWGLVQFFVGALPQSYSRYAGWFGITGNSEVGERLIRSTKPASGGSSFAAFDFIHTWFVGAYVFPEEYDTSELNVNFQERIQEYPILVFTLARKAVLQKETDRALRILGEREVDERRLTFWYLDYLEGINLTRKLDPRGARILLDYLSGFPGYSYKKSTLMFLSWYFFLDGDYSSSYYYKERVQRDGKAFTGADKEAQNLSTQDIPGELIEARLLCDGGYYSEAEKRLMQKDPEKYVDVLNVQEWYYRNARIQMGLKDLDQAIQSFKKVVETPFDNRRKFLPVSCYELGLIYLDRGDEEEAKYWLERALSYSGYPYVADYQRIIKPILKKLDH
ncbi:hypothetical protein HZ996_07675 [Cryomorphaceae bacterium]|nr:hypothetical protein HZ996_07675 [Cryomorphaceae bacterium]